MNPTIAANRARLIEEQVASYERARNVERPALTERQLRTLFAAESAQALKLAVEAGVEIPNAQH